MAMEPENDQSSSVEKSARPGPILGTLLLQYAVFLLILLAMGVLHFSGFCHCAVGNRIQTLSSQPGGHIIPLLIKDDEC